MLATGQIVIAIGEDFGLNDRHYSRALADGGVTREDVGVLEDRELAGAILLDLEDASPLGEVAAVLLVLDAAGLEIVEALGRALVIGAEQRHYALVDLDAGNDVALLQEVHEGCAVVGLLVEGLVEEDHAGDMLADDVLQNVFKLFIISIFLYVVTYDCCYFYVIINKRNCIVIIRIIGIFIIIVIIIISIKIVL